MNSDIVLTNELITIKAPGGVTVVDETTFMDKTIMGEVTAADISANTLSTQWVKAITVNTTAIQVIPHNDLVLAATIVKATATDLQLDNQGRRVAAGGYRRALVHDVGDGLTINYAGDYPAGVTVHGAVTVPNGLTTAGITMKSPEVSVAAPGPTPGSGGAATTWHELVLDGTTIVAKSFRNDKAHGTTEQTLDVLLELRKLRAEVNELSDEVDELKAKVAALPGQGA